MLKIKRKKIKIKEETFQLALKYQEEGKLDHAEFLYRKILKENPHNYAICNNLGHVLRKKEHLDEAVTFFEKAIQINPNFAMACANLGLALQDMGKPDDAIICFQKELQLNPNCAEAHNDLGFAFQEKEQINKAIMNYKKAIELNPTFVMAHWNLSHALLMSGDFNQGWQEYEWRWKLKDVYKLKLSQPIWDGSDIAESTILLHTEQGFGDNIQFMRYVPLVAERSARVIIGCQKELLSLFRHVNGVYQVVMFGELSPQFDVYCPLARLPLIFNASIETIPAKIPYIKVDTSLFEKWKHKVKHDYSRLKVGLVWSAGGLPRKKSFMLETFSPLGQHGDITFYSLQKGGAAKQANDPPNRMKLLNYMEEIEDFTETAALIESLDLIISVDTAVAHLAGALGKPIWTLLPFAPDWRWMLKRQDSPWYPTMKLFRQPSPGDWESVIATVRNELYKLLNKN